MEYSESYQGTQSYAFISYAHADSEMVLPLLSALQERGIQLWYDSGIEIGTEWPEYIAQALHNSSCVLCFLSPNAVNSDNCRREINFAIAQKKDILAIYLEEDFPRPLGIAMQLDSIQAVFLPRYTDINHFLDALTAAKLLQNCRGEGRSPIPAPNVPVKSAEPIRHQPALYAFWSKDCIKSSCLSVILLLAIALFYLIGSIVANHPGPFLIVSLPIIAYELIYIFTEKSKVENAGFLRRKVASEHQVICEGPASLVPQKIPKISVGSKHLQKGWLFLTNDAILFYPISFEKRHSVLSLPLAEITKAEVHSGKSGGLVLETIGDSYSFSVFCTKRWIQSIYDITM